MLLPPVGMSEAGLASCRRGEFLSPMGHLTHRRGQGAEKRTEVGERRPERKFRPAPDGGRALPRNDQESVAQNGRKTRLLNDSPSSRRECSPSRTEGDLCFEQRRPGKAHALPSLASNFDGDALHLVFAFHLSVAAVFLQDEINDARSGWILHWTTPRRSFAPGCRFDFTSHVTGADGRADFPLPKFLFVHHSVFSPL